MLVYQVEASGNLNAFGELSQRPHVITLPWISIFKGVPGFPDIEPEEYAPLKPIKRQKAFNQDKAIIKAIKAGKHQYGILRMVSEEFGVSYQCVSDLKQKHLSHLKLIIGPPKKQKQS